MALYAQAISHPYIQHIRAPGKDLNMLDLGAIEWSFDSYAKIINTPDLLVGPKVSHTTGALYGQKWENQSFFLLWRPWLTECLTWSNLWLFFQWSQEHGRGSLQSSHLVELLEAHLKEGFSLDSPYQWFKWALGSYRQFMRFKPLASLLHFNAKECIKNTSLVTKTSLRRITEMLWDKRSRK